MAQTAIDPTRPSHVSATSPLNIYWSPQLGFLRSDKVHSYSNEAVSGRAGPNSIAMLISRARGPYMCIPIGLSPGPARPALLLLLCALSRPSHLHSNCIESWPGRLPLWPWSRPGRRSFCSVARHCDPRSGPVDLNTLCDADLRFGMALRRLAIAGCANVESHCVGSHRPKLDPNCVRTQSRFQFVDPTTDPQGSSNKHSLSYGVGAVSAKPYVFISFVRRHPSGPR